MSKIIIYESELAFIARQTARFPDTETGGDLFGLWTQTGSAVVQYVLGAGPHAHGHEMAFYQDRAFLEEYGAAINARHGLQHIGEWHSHHRLALRQPSGGDVQTVRNALHTYRLNQFLVCICNLADETVLIDGFNFPVQTSLAHPYHRCAWVVLPGTSPLRRAIDREFGWRTPRASDEVLWQVEPLTSLSAPRAALTPDVWISTPAGKACFQSVYARLKQVCGDVRVFQQADQELALLCHWDGHYLELTFPTQFPAAPYRVAAALDIDGEGRLVQPAPLPVDEDALQPLLDTVDEVVRFYYPDPLPQEQAP